MLQLDIAGGTYDTSSSTTVNNSNPFTLGALFNLDGNSLTGNYFISAAVVPQQSVLNNSFGSFSITPEVGPAVTFDGTNMLWGTPPVSLLYPDLPGHSIFPTVYAEIGFSFSTNAAHHANLYNVQDDAGDWTTRLNSSGKLLFQTFSVDVSGLKPGYEIHFDLYDEYLKKQGKKSVNDLQFAPFSHDAQGHQVHVPDGGTTLALLGLGLAGLGFIRRKVA